MTENPVTVYATEWCPDCRRARRFLDEHSVPYRWVNIDHDKAAEQFVIQTNNGNRSVPTIIWPDGTILVEPSNLKLEQQLTR